MAATREPGTPLILADRAAALLDELLFHRVLEHIDVDGLQQLETELWVTLIKLDVEMQARAPIAEARADRSRASALPRRSHSREWRAQR